MVKKEYSKKNAKGKMKLKSEDDPITISDNGEVEYPPPKKGKILRYTPFLRYEGINYEEFVRGITVKINDHHGVGNYIPEGNMIELMYLYNGLPFVVRSTDDLRDMWAQGDESYPMRTHFYTKPTDVVREMVDEVGEYVLLDDDYIDYIISPRETKEKNTKGILVKDTPVKTNYKRNGKAVIMSPPKPNKAANKPAKRQKKKEKVVVLSKEEGEDLVNLPEVYHSGKEININDFEIETPMNIVVESESECDDIDEEQDKWARYAQVGIDCLGDEDGYYSTHSSDDEDYVLTVEDLERGSEFESVDVDLDDIYSKDEDGKVKTPLTVGFKKLEVGMQWATEYEAREHMRRFGILNHFTYTCIKNDSTRLRLKCSQEKWVQNTVCNAAWVAKEIESLVRDAREMTPKAIKARMKIMYGVKISYWTTWNARQICMGSIRRRGRPKKERIKGDDEVNKHQKRCGKCSAFGHNKQTCKGEPIQIYPPPVLKAKGRPSKKSTKVYFSQSQQSYVTQAQTTPIAGGRGSSGRASNVVRGRGRLRDVSSALNSSNAGRGRERTGDVLTPSNSGRGRGRTEGVTRGLNAGSGKGRAMQTNNQRFVDEWLSNSVPVEAPQSQERPPLVIPPMPPRTDAPANPYKRTFKPPRQNWRL
ncbi:hypothetical protein GIB67_010273 [Kingdonia uniflora]|uniref:Transposase MuDR plant domain-containing protein n=1 Tax=Kingdonia uniflora TaxID=39325 RepID=A0A7J7NB34_9MAGN|nr:hypothetical protein GIB67_010273 [Kingdonia uniflora]